MYTFFLFLIVLFCLMFFQIYKCYLIWKKYLWNIPVPKDAKRNLRDPTKIHKKGVEYCLEYNGLFRISIFPFWNIIVLSDPKYIKKVMALEKGLKRNYSHLTDWLGNGLLTSDDEIWRPHRRLLAPCFAQFSIMKDFVKIFEEHGDILVQILHENIENKRIDFMPLFKMYSMDIICKSAMGLSTNSLIGKNSHYLECVENLFHIAQYRAVHPYLKYSILFKLTKHYKIQKECLEVIDDFFYKIMETKQENYENVDGDGCNKQNVLDIMLEQEKKQSGLFTLKDIRDQVNTIVSGGYDTTSTALICIAYELARHIEIQEKILEEQKEIFGDLKANFEVSYADLQQMKYLEMVIFEGLRMHPSAPVFARILQSEFQLDENYTLPPHSHIIFFVYGCHHDPKYFPEPEKFKPERFEGKIFDSSYIPFGAGMRSCVGKRFAILQMKSCISKLVRNFIMSPSDPNEKLTTGPTILNKAFNGVHISLKKRE